MIGLYSKRWSVAKGWHWKYERDCSEENIYEWLRVFQMDEPGVTFRFSKINLTNKKI